MSGVASALVLVVGAMPVARAHAQERRADAELERAAGQLVSDSLLGGPLPAGAVLIATDSATARVLRAAGVPVARVAPQADVACTGTDATAPQASPADESGRTLGVSIRSTSDPAEVEVSATFSCTWRYRGQRRGLFEGRAWALRRTTAGWRVVRTVGAWVSD